MQRFIPLVVCLFCLVLKCDNNNPVDGELSLLDQYQNAIIDAMVAEESEIDSNLIAITINNSRLTWNGNSSDPRVLVVTWTKYPDSYPVGDTVETWWGYTWVTVVPEIRDWFESHPTDSTEIVLRSNQLLGLPPDDDNTHFVEMWVRPIDLFRPAPDNEIDDQTTGLDFPDSTASWYENWFNDNIIYSYFPPRYPWTRLGYTYDWGNTESEIGISEFVVIQNARVVVEDVNATINYLY